MRYVRPDTKVPSSKAPLVIVFVLNFQEVPEAFQQ